MSILSRLASAFKKPFATNDASLARVIDLGQTALYGYTIDNDYLRWDVYHANRKFGHFFAASNLRDKDVIRKHYGTTDAVRVASYHLPADGGSIVTKEELATASKEELAERVRNLELIVRNQGTIINSSLSASGERKRFAIRHGWQPSSAESEVEFIYRRFEEMAKATEDQSQKLTG